MSRRSKLTSVAALALLSFACSEDGSSDIGQPSGTAPETPDPNAPASPGTGGTPATGGGASTPVGVPAAGGGSGIETPACMPIMASAGATLEAPKLVIAEIALGGTEEHIVIYNNSSETLGLEGFGLCSNFLFYKQLNELTPESMIAPGAFLSLEIHEAFDGIAGASPATGELLIFEGASSPERGLAGADVHDYVCWGSFSGGRKESDGGEQRYSGDCAPAMTAGALRRIPGTGGEDAASYDVSVSPDSCAP